LKKVENSFPKMEELIDNSLINIGDEVYITIKPDDSNAVLVDSKHVLFNDKVMTINDWGCLVTGWKSIRIYAYMARVGEKDTLQEKREALLKEQGLSSDAKALSNTKKGNTKEERQIFWNLFNEQVVKRGNLFETKEDTTEHWHRVRLGKKIHISITLINSDHLIGVSARIPNDKELYNKLYLNRESIEHELGFQPEWVNDEKDKVSYIIYYIKDLDFSNHSNYDELINETIDKTLRMRDTIRKYL